MEAQPELKLLKDDGWTDTVEEYCRKKHGGKTQEFRTWVAANPHTALTVPMEPDARIDYCWVKGPKREGDGLARRKIKIEEARLLTLTLTLTLI